MGGLDVERSRIEMPDRCPGPAQQIGVEAQERGGLALVVDDHRSVDTERQNCIAAMPMRGTGVEELGVLVALSNHPALARLFPMGALMKNGSSEPTTGIMAKELLICRQSTVFFQKIQEISHENTIIIEHWNEHVLLLPYLSRRSECFLS